MSKSIYDEALEIVDESLYQQDNSVIFKHTALNLLKKSLEQAQKQEKLLELYKQLNIIYEKLYNMELSIDLEKELGLIYDVKILKQRIKELEK